MKMIFLSLVVLLSTSAMAQAAETSVTCTFGEKVLTLDLLDNQVVLAQWQNPDWSDYGAHVVDLANLNYDGKEAVIKGDDIPDANGPYICQ